MPHHAVSTTIKLPGNNPPRNIFSIVTLFRLTFAAPRFAIVLLAMISVGYLFGRQFIGPILQLQRGTQALAAGHLEERVDICFRDGLAIREPRHPGKDPRRTSSLVFADSRGPLRPAPFTRLTRVARSQAQGPSPRPYLL